MRCRDCGGATPGRHPRCDDCVWENPPQHFNRQLGRWVIMLNGRRKMLRNRWVMERHLGRPLRPHEVVHHKNHDPTDDRIENLQLMSRAAHLELHRDELHAARGAATGGRWSGVADACVDCATSTEPHMAKGRCARCYGRLHRSCATTQRTCQSCGTQYPAYKPNQRYCSPSCRSRAAAVKRWGSTEREAA